MINAVQITSDNFPIYLAVVFSLLGAILYCAAGAAARRVDEDAEPTATEPSSVSRWARFCCYGAAGSFSFALLYLLMQILSRARYDLSYVYGYSSPHDETIYRVSALWAGQEGSMLLWLTLCAWAAVLIAARTRDRMRFAVSFYMLTVAVFGVVLLISDPFARTPDFRPGMVGSGLNPLLQNPWVAIHPPVIFLGYVALMVPIAFVVDAVLRRRCGEWASVALPWTVFGWVCLGTGIAMGMVWSYEVLGWGGYWGWDPVENASLVPWLISCALIHGLLVQRRTGRLMLANRALAVSLFVSIIYAAFLTRSGVLSELSVHSFGDGGAYTYWNSVMAVVVLVGLAIVVLRCRGGKSDTAPRNLTSADKLVVLGVVGLVLFSIAVLVGTSLPLVTQTVIKPRFYNHLAAPIALLVVLLTTALAFTRRRLTAASQLAHSGVALLLIGAIFSAGAKSAGVSLDKNGPSAKAFGYSFSYKGRRAEGAGREVAQFTAKKDGRQFDVPIVTRFAEGRAVRFPYVRQRIISDLYVAPVEIGSATITPTASVREEGWVALPAELPGTEATVTIQGMQVEQNMVKLKYQPVEGEPSVVEAFKGRPVEVDGLTLEVMRLIIVSSKDMSGVTAGADIAVSGGNIKETAVIDVSVKPLVSLVWLGLLLITVGGIMAAANRIREGSRGRDWDSTH